METPDGFIRRAFCVIYMIWRGSIPRLHAGYRLIPVYHRAGLQRFVEGIAELVHFAQGIFIAFLGLVLQLVIIIDGMAENIFFQQLFDFGNAAVDADEEMFHFTELMKFFFVEVVTLQHARITRQHDAQQVDEPVEFALNGCLLFFESHDERKVNYSAE